MGKKEIWERAAKKRLIGDISRKGEEQIPVALSRRVYPLIVLDSLNSLSASQRAVLFLFQGK
jgi:hypothetical protein